MAMEAEVYLVDLLGQVNIFWVEGGGNEWQGPYKLGPLVVGGFDSEGFAQAGSALAASLQFGQPAQTDVFVVDNDNGQVNVFSADGTGTWKGPRPISFGGFAVPGSAVAVSQDFSVTGRTDVFFVDLEGRLNVYWVDDAGTPSGPELIGPEDFAPPGCALAASAHFGTAKQTDVFLVDNGGRLTVARGDQPGKWKAPTKLSDANFAPPGSGIAALQHYGVPNRTDVFVVDGNGQLQVFWLVSGQNWQNKPIGAPETFTPGTSVAASPQFGVVPNQTDVFLVDTDGVLNVFSGDEAGNWSLSDKLGSPGSFASGSAGLPGDNARPGPAGGAIAAGQRFGEPNQTDVFLVDNYGQLNIFSVVGDKKWQQPPVKLGPMGSMDDGVVVGSDFAPGGAVATAARSRPSTAIRIPINNLIMNGQYTAQVKIGSRGAVANVSLDTGSGPFVVKSGVYNPTDDTDALTTRYFQQENLGIGAGGGWSGPVVQTSVSVGSAQRDVSVATYLAIASDPITDAFGHADGILGLAYAKKNLAVLDGQEVRLPSYFCALESNGVVKNIFSFYTHRSLTNHALDNPAKDPLNYGLLVLGGGLEQIDLYHGDVMNVAVVQDVWYNTNLLEMQVADTIISAPPSSEPSNSIIDTGTPFLVLPQIMFDAFLLALAAANPQFPTFIQTANAAESVALMSDLDLASWPPISFMLQGETGEPVLLHCSPTTYWQTNTPGPGHARFRIASGGAFSMSILGLPLMNNYYTVFDRSQDSLGVIRFAPITPLAI